MTWRIVIARTAARTLGKAPKNDRARILKALGDMRENPYAGDIVALRGVHKGAFRRRVGSWRLLFEIDTGTHSVSVTDIRRRTSTRY